MFVQIKDNSVFRFPYSIQQLRRDNPNTSFPSNPSEEALADFGVYPVFTDTVPEYDQKTHLVEYATAPILRDGRWTLTVEIKPLSQEQLDERRAAEAASVRQERDRLLSDTDWVVVKSMETGAPVPAEWGVYRQALRDITNHVNFPHLAEEDWPVKP